MAVGVVDPLERIQINHAQGQTMIVPRGTGHFPLQRLLKIAPVEQAGQLITHRHLCHFLLGHAHLPFNPAFQGHW
jgi:hypothetical protein